MYLIVMAEPSGRNDPDEYDRLSSAGPSARSINWAGFPGSKTKKAGVKKKSSKKVERVCLVSGYAYELDPAGGDWTKAKDDYWEMVSIDGGPADVLGKRSIDGSLVIVARQGGSIYAQTAISVKKCAEPARRPVDWSGIEADFPDKSKKRTPRKLHRKTPGLYAEELTDGWTVVDPEGGRWWPNEKARQAISRSKNPAATALRIADGIDDRDYLRGLGGDFVD